ncbi:MULTISPECIES: ATP-binding protein [Rhizobium]|uniref:Uncharacterized protein n=1 Tax=Rhizobium johnstonii (strain DSM 114642 / LMG 32736 / 3841) TaxID=216596 RepID=Q1MI18_RHIJ3|nr:MULTISPECIES: ATP-binding protein [Rhizobium]MBB4389366.1 type II secretory pathway predicted ATPase ExeA [Rhizobium leguminosarum]MBB5261245.1 type II secretory pathway predicted ATPase ExeA [Rhizobium leguminosarum]MBY5378087.1 AAA family ATPase [Rhizobium leguminosarum]MDX6000376.1 ATP-binding protein [Rhizobium leguminosarum]NEJ80981.1 AAA family ATPase [Rhizobium leguminosarum]
MIEQPATSMMEHLLRTASRKTVDRAAIIKKIQDIHVPTTVDDELAKEIEIMLAHIMSGNATSGYALTILGKSGAGKSKALDHLLDNHPSFASFDGLYNRMSLSLRAVTPPSCTWKKLGARLAAQSGLPVHGETNEDVVWNDILLDRMRKMGTRVIVLDEFQHVLEAPTSHAYTHLSNSIKNLMQTPSYPIWVIVSGVPEIEGILDRDEHKQLDRRVPIIRVKDMPNDETTVGKVVETVQKLADASDIRIGFPLIHEFVQRLMHGGIWRFGMTVQIIKNSLEKCIWDDKAGGVLLPNHFAQGYARLARDCPDEQNVFKSADWQKIQREVDDKGYLVDPASAPKRRRKKG